MAFEDKELSNYEGQPINLYKFSNGERNWFYCTDPEDQTIGGNTYLGVNASDDGFKQSGDPASDDLVITLPIDVEVASLFVGTPPADEILVTIRRYHRGELGTPICWIGSVYSARKIGITSIEFTCRMETGSFKRGGLRLFWGRQCPHALYDHNCRVDPDDFAYVSTVTAKTGVRITVLAAGGFAANWFTNGYVEWEIQPGVLDRRGIERHNGDNLNLLGLTDGIEIGNFVKLLPGCSRTIPHCVDKFNNLSNYGGIPHLPGKSPFGGDPVF